MSSVLSMQKNLTVLVVMLVWNNFSNAYNETGKILSRKRRYLLFPEGSSLQLVYDFTVPISYSQTIFVFSTTAALAWMLPSTIEEFQNGFFSKKFHKVPSNRIDTQKTNFTKLEPVYNHEFWNNKPYEKYIPHITSINSKGFNYNSHRPLRYQSTIEKSPAYLQSTRRKYYDFNNKNVNNVYRNTVKGGQSYYRPVTTYVDPVHVHYHRRTARDLFKKIEKFLTAQKKDGRSCVLKAICEVNEESARRKGTFTEEIFKALFRFGSSYDGENDVYDKAADNSHSCSEMYPCDFSIWAVI